MDTSRSIRHLLPVLALFFGLGLLVGDAVAQQKTTKEQLVGTWMIVAIDDLRPDGSRVPLFGPDPQGMLMFDADGRYSLQLCRAGRPKFTSNNRLKGTPEENQAIVHGCNPHWGRYSVNETDRTVTFYIDHAMYPNWEGTQQKRSFALEGDELKYTVPYSDDCRGKPRGGMETRQVAAMEESTT